jgi:hypothetical protein
MEIRRTKNLATYIVFPIMKNDGTLISGAAGLDSEIDTFADGAAPDGFTDCTNEATEIGSTGQYYLSLTQAEMNADYIIIQVKSSTSGAVVQTILINTTLQRADAVAISGDTTAADNLEKACDGTTYNIGGGAVVAASVTGAVGSVTGAVGSVAANGITATSIASDAINAAAVKADAVTKIQNGLALASALATVAGYLDTEIAAILVIAQKLDTALELDGAVYRYTLNALELAPTGGSAPTVEEIRAEIDSNSTQLAAIKAKTDNLPTHPQKNVALSNIPFKMFLSSDHVTPATGKTVTGTTSKDAGAFGAISGTITEISNGWYKLDAASQSEMNGNHIVFEFSAADCDVTTIEFLTST